MNRKENNKASLRSFLILWATQSLSSVGTGMTNYALVIWVYNQHGTASSLTLLSLCSFLPTILFRFIAGAVSDRWDKKRIMLAADLVAACGTLAVFALYRSSALTIVHLCAINFLLSCMDAFQVPAAYVATSLLVPKEQYTRVGGLQSVGGAVVSIVTPALAGVVLARGGLPAVLIVDLITFAIALLALLCIRIPKVERSAQAVRESFWQNCLAGLWYLKKHSHLLRLIAFIATVNLLAKLGTDNLLAGFVLSRTNGSQAALSAVKTAVTLGALAGGIAVSMMKPPANSVRTIFIMCSLLFLAGAGMALCQSTIGWCATAFLQYLFAAVMNVHWNALMRTNVPPEMQGRVFSARDTVQNCAIPLGIYLGGILADGVFEPLMGGNSVAQRILSHVFGTGNGAGIAVQFFLVSVIGLAISGACINRRSFQRPEEDSPKE